MPLKPAPNLRELRILATLWELGEASVKALVDSQGLPKPQHFSTTRKLLAIVERRGWVKRIQHEGRITFAANITQEQAVDMLAETLLSGLSGCHMQICDESELRDGEELRKLHMKSRKAD